MKIVDQRSIDPDTGDCFRACLASLLEIPYEEAFDIIAARDGNFGWGTPFGAWLKSKGFSWEGNYSNEGKPLDPWELIKISPGLNRLYIGWGYSPRFENVTHAVIVDGDIKIVHDPHPSRLGVKDGIWGVYLIERNTP